jgi:hypothetical protein
MHDTRADPNVLILASVAISLAPHRKPVPISPHVSTTTHPAASHRHTDIAFL